MTAAEQQKQKQEQQQLQQQQGEEGPVFRGGEVNFSKAMASTDRPRTKMKIRREPEQDVSESLLATAYIDSHNKEKSKIAARDCLSKLVKYSIEKYGIKDASEFDSFVVVKLRKEHYALKRELLLGQEGETVHDPRLEIFNYLLGFKKWLNERGSLSSNSISSLLHGVKKFFKAQKFEIDNHEFLLTVKPPKKQTEDKAAMSVSDVREILMAASHSSFRLFTYLLLLAATGMRPIEACSIRLCDIDFQSDIPRVNIRKEYTKTGKARYVYLTKEAANTLQKYIVFKYRSRRIPVRDTPGGEIVDHQVVSPEPNPQDLVFGGGYVGMGTDKPRSLYVQFAEMYPTILDLVGRGGFEDNGKRRKFTLHSYRRYVKTTISNAGNPDYSEWFIGHSGSTYYRLPEEERARIFKSVEPRLTILDYNFLEEKQKMLEGRVDSMAQQMRANAEIMAEVKSAILDCKKGTTSATSGSSASSYL